MRRTEIDPIEDGYHSDEGMGFSSYCSACSKRISKRYYVRSVIITGREEEVEMCECGKCEDCLADRLTTREVHKEMKAKYFLCPECVCADLWLDNDVEVERSANM